MGCNVIGVYRWILILALIAFVLPSCLRNAQWNESEIKYYPSMDVLTKAASREEIGEVRTHGFGFCRSRKSLWHCPEKNGNGYTLRWMGAQESEVKMIEVMYENTKARVVVGSGMSNEFQANIGLRQGSALSPLLFIFVMELISRKISTTDALRKIM